MFWNIGDDITEWQIQLANAIEFAFFTNFLKRKQKD